MVHTPAPWTLKPTGDHKAIRVIGNTLWGNDIAEVDSDDADREESEANAYLISKAPELFELLAIMFDAYENGTPCYEDPISEDDFIGYALHLDEKTFHCIADLLNNLESRITSAESE